MTFTSRATNVRSSLLEGCFFRGRPSLLCFRTMVSFLVQRKVHPQLGRCLLFYRE